MQKPNLKIQAEQNVTPVQLAMENLVCICCAVIAIINLLSYLEFFYSVSW